MDMGTAVAIVGVSLSTGWTIVKCKSRPNCKEHIAVNNLLNNWKEFSRLLISALSDIASIKQSVIDLSVFVCDKGPNGEGKCLRDKIIDEMMKRHRNKNCG